MNKTFDTVDFKVAETEFFLQKMATSGFDIIEFKFYFSAFLASARTITLALQQFKDIEGFSDWYAPHQEKLKKDRNAKFFLDTRNNHLHGGSYPIGGGCSVGGVHTFHFRDFDLKESDFEDDIVLRSRDFFIILLQVVYDCYVVLGCHINPQQHYTREHFSLLGRTLIQAEYEVFGWSNESMEEGEFTEDDRWHYLRSKVDDCKIDHLFHAYLNRITPRPIEPEHYQDFEYTDEEKGWSHIPAGFDSIEDWIKHIKVKNA